MKVTSTKTIVDYIVYFYPRLTRPTVDAVVSDTLRTNDTTSGATSSICSSLSLYVAKHYTPIRNLIIEVIK